MSLESLLADAGWSPSGNRDISRLPSNSSLGFVLHDAASRFLRQFVDLSVSVPIDGFPNHRGYVQFTPENVFRLFSSDSPIFDRLDGDVYPVGTTGGHTFFILMDQHSNFYLVEMNGELFGKIGSSDSEALNCLCGGDNGRVDSYVIQDGRFTGHIINAENQIDFWDLEQFQDLLPILPLESLCPLRYPPTWEAMSKTLQQLLVNNPTPRADWNRISITSGGALLSPSGQPYFVYHRENAIYMREQGGFNVVTPPYGIGVPTCQHIGQCVPVDR